MVEATAIQAKDFVAETSAAVTKHSRPDAPIARAPLPRDNASKWLKHQAAVLQRPTADTLETERSAIEDVAADVIDVPLARKF